ncbi:hypothetical protein FHT72_001072 [Rhizobium sp. BK077]|uniref:hypothetical protein n=1 Tax=Rhizobium TaxID=379 RepID=UPI000BE8FEAD|nr:MULTISPECIES: hypothetical protein [Rhizobium]MBB3298090.1 hypothetical protein [Rhizobium sp. BK112]MBB3366605.1 hypothetical protein [Rhizobium sp. BK077]MBB4177416.1 hypothetical protein [Rhizobium sp. BK109]PDS39150.1 hypothetical protein CO665_07555 [Rhizobium anhuiense]
MTAAGRKKSEAEAVPEKKATNHATWKFELENTINADPQCDGECLKIVRAYLDFMGSADTCPYRSLIELRVATRLAKGTIISRRKKLVKLGYFTPAGVTSDGVQRYRIVNARENHVLEHQTAFREYLRERDAEEKEMERRKRKTKAAASSPSLCGSARDDGLGGPRRKPLNDVRGVTACTDRGPRREPNYVEHSVDSFSMERGAISQSASFPTCIDVVVPHDFLIGDEISIGDDVLVEDEVSIEDELDLWLPKLVGRDSRLKKQDEIEPTANGGRHDA